MNGKTDKQAEMRRLAEEKVHKEEDGGDATPTLEESRRLLHELRVHQAELEMQNEELRRTQMELASSKARYFDLFDLAPVGYMTVSKKGIVLESNLTAAYLLGANRGELVKKPFTQFILAEDQDIYYRHRKMLFETGLPKVCELRLLHAEGPPLWIRLQGAVSLDGDLGEQVSRVILSDITAHKREHEQLLKTNERLAFAQRSAGTGTWDWDMTSGTLEWSPELFELFGLPSSGSAPTFDLWRSVVHPLDRQAAEERINKAVQDHVPLQNEYRIVRPDGKERWIWSLGNTFFDGSGRARRMSGICIDITARKRAEENVLSTRNYLDKLISATPDPLFVKDREHRWILVNDAFCSFMGRSREKLLGKSDYEFLPKEQADVFWEKDEIVFRTKEENTNEEELTDSNGFTHVILTKKVLSTDGDGNEIIIGSIRDITDRKRAEEDKSRLSGQLQQAMKMEAVGRLAGGVAHDFNNLLTGITGNVSLALMDMNPADPLHSILEEVNKAAESAASLTRQLLAFSRKQIVEARTVNLGELVSNLSKMLVRLIGEDIDLKITLARDLQAVKIDPGQFEQVIVNLIVNARDAMPDGGELSVETAQAVLDSEYCRTRPGLEPGGYVMLLVNDTGQGMSEEVKSHLFEPFFTTKPIGRGTGLGLATIYGTVKQAGGYVEVESEIGRGTTFRIYLPPAEGKAEKLAKVTGAPEMRGGDETILVVEDEPMVRNMTIKFLRRLGYNVLHAENGAVALAEEEGRKARIDLLVTDVIMPGINGKQLAARLRRAHPEMAVLFTSGYTDDILTEHGLEEENLNFISKPYPPIRLALKIREVLDRR